MLNLNWIPRSRPGRARLLMVVLGCVVVVLPSAGPHPGESPGISALISTLARIALLVCLVGTALRGRTTIYEPALTTLLVVLVGIDLEAPLSIVLVCIGVIITQSMYGSRSGTLLRTLGLALTVPLTASEALSQSHPQLRWYSRETFAQIILILLFSVLIRALKNTLDKQADSIVRARLTSALTRNLLIAETMRDVDASVRTALDTLVLITPGLIILTLTHDEPNSSAVVCYAPGQNQRDPIAVPGTMLSNIYEKPSNRVSALAAASDALVEVGLPRRKWYVQPNVPNPRAGGEPSSDLLLFGIDSTSRSMIPNDPGEAEFVALLNLILRNRQTVLDALHEQSHLSGMIGRDEVTGLLNRSSFEELVMAEAASEQGCISVVLLRVDGLDQIEARNGLAGVDVAVAETAHRIVEEVGTHRLVGRYDDRTFGVLISDGAAPEDVAVLVRNISLCMGEPIHLIADAWALEISVGVSRGEDHTSGADLLQQALSNLPSPVRAST